MNIFFFIIKFMPLLFIIPFIYYQNRIYKYKSKIGEFVEIKKGIQPINSIYHLFFILVVFIQVITGITYLLYERILPNGYWFILIGFISVIVSNSTNTYIGENGIIIAGVFYREDHIKEIYLNKYDSKNKLSICLSNGKRTNLLIGSSMLVKLESILQKHDYSRKE